MSEQLNEFEQMLEESLKTIRTGEIVTGKVIDVKEDEIVLNIGYKSDGIIPRNEYTNESGVDLTTVVKVGDEMEAKVVKVNDGEGQVALSYKRLAADRPKIRRGVQQPGSADREGSPGSGWRLKRCGGGIQSVHPREPGIGFL